LDWPLPVRIQSQHLADYTTALEQLRAGGFVYPCFCTRREIEQEAGRSAHAPHTAEGGPIYPGTCRVLSQEERAARMAQHREMNWRLDSEKALRVAGPLFWHDKRKGRVACRPGIFGDVVLARKDVPTSYHLSVTVDDHLQGVTLVTRGDDLFDSTHIHRLLQALLGYETPEYDHHALMTDGEGRRYAKRDQSVTLRSLRAAGKNATDILSALFPGRVSVR
jgi:glutamyl-Q tRNA(Asp) synthetase